MSVTSVESYLFFGGKCEAALDFYKTAIGAQIGKIMHFNESPEPMPEGKLQAGFETKVMHSIFTVGNTQIMASDGMAGGKPEFKGFSLSVTAKDAAEADRLFAALGKGGQVQMPLGKTFFSPRFGMVADKFGVGWMVIVPGAM